VRELFVYYRVDAASVRRARQAVDAMQGALRSAHPGLQTRLLERIAVDGRITWMETYAFPAAARPAGVDAAIEKDIVERARPLAPFFDGDRHVEAFHACGEG